MKPGILDEMITAAIVVSSVGYYRKHIAEQSTELSPATTRPFRHDPRRPAATTDTMRRDLLSAYAA